MGSAPLGLITALQDRYRLDRELGAGGMATVYLAYDLKHDREVALKVLRPELAAVLGRERFLTEIRLTARLDHPHILTLIDSGESDGFLWYVVQFIRGESLRQKLEREKQLGVEEALGIIKQVAGALEYAHQHGVIHRDLKPENILLHEGEAMLADFGIALAVKEAGGNRLTETGLSLGTPQYMSPEQATGDRLLDARSDVYSLAAVLYELLAGEPPHSGPTVQAIIAKLMTERPTRLRVVRDTVPEGIDNAVAKALAKVPPDRYQDVAAFVHALEAGPPIVATTRSQRRRWGMVTGAAAILASLVFGALQLRHATMRAVPRVYDRVQLTSSGTASSPVLSPDGSQVAYMAVQCTEEAGDCVYGIVTRDIATGAERTLVENLGWSVLEQWSPDGVRLLYYTWGRGNAGGTYSISRLGGKPTYLGIGAGSFLNGGDTAVVAAQLGATSTVYLRRFALPSSQPLDSIPVTKPGNVTGLGSLSVSPDGRWIALGWFGGGGYGLVTLHSRSGALNASATAPAVFVGLCWSADSRALLIPARREGSVLKFAVDPATSRLVDGIDTIPIAAGSGSVAHVALSGDGHSLVYESDREGESVMWTLARPAPGVPPRPLRRAHTASSSFDGFIPRDGRVVFYSEKTQSSGRLLTQWFAAPFDSGAGHPITPPLADLIDITSTHDAKIFFTATRSPGGGATITAYDIATGNARLFSREGSDHLYIWEGPAGGVVVISGGGDSLRILDASGHEVQQIIVPDSIPKLASLFWSPDGKDFVIFPQVPATVAADGNFDVKLYRVSVADGRFHAITSLKVVELYGKTWTDDGYLHFFATTATDPRIRSYRLRPQGGTPEPEGLQPFKEPVSCTMAGDDRRWTCVVSQTLSDVYLIRNFDTGGH